MTRHEHTPPPLLSLSYSSPRVHRSRTGCLGHPGVRGDEHHPASRHPGNEPRRGCGDTGEEQDPSRSGEQHRREVRGSLFILGHRQGVCPRRQGTHPITFLIAFLFLRGLGVGVNGRQRGILLSSLSLPLVFLPTSDGDAVSPVPLHLVMACYQSNLP